MAYMRLGDLLLSSGVISHEQLERALELQKESKERLGDVLVQSGIITEQQLIEALKIQLGVEFVDLTAVSIPVELAKYVPRTLAKKYCVVPVKLVRDTLYLAMSDPLDFIAQEMNREANTILSKANDLEISNIGIELKTEIEKVREQIQNIE